MLEKRELIAVVGISVYLYWPLRVPEMFGIWRLYHKVVEVAQYQYGPLVFATVRAFRWIST